MRSSKKPSNAAKPKPKAKAKPEVASTGEITGSLIVRDTSVKLASHPGKKIMCVFGVIAVPAGADIPTGHLFPLVGTAHDGLLALHLMTVGGKDIDGDVSYRGYSADQLLTSSIWKV